MNLARHVAVLWRFRLIAGAGLLLGVVFALVASYHVPSMKPRGAEEWTAVSSILVTQPGFPEGRVTLPTKQTAIGPADAAPPSNPNEVEFADPGRLSALADLYSRFLTSDDVLRRVPSRPGADKVIASPFASSQAGLLLPVIELTTKAPAEAAAVALNRQVFDSLRALLREQAAANGIADNKQVQVRIINTPDDATLTSGRTKTGAILAFLLCALGTLAVIHILEGLRPRPVSHNGVVTLLERDDFERDGVARGVEPPQEAFAGYASAGRRVVG